MDVAHIDSRATHNMFYSERLLRKYEKIKEVQMNVEKRNNFATSRGAVTVHSEENLKLEGRH